MKVLITSDGHLNKGEPERLGTFLQLVEQGIEEEIDALLVGGDLFHSNRAFRSLKGEITRHMRKLGPDFEVLTVPGNHDSEVSSSNFLGKNFTVLDEKNRRKEVYSREDKLEVIGLPFTEGTSTAETGNILPKPSEGVNSILLTHGSLIDPNGNYAFTGPLDEREDKEHLLFREDLEKIEYDLVVLGHWHGTKLIEGREGYFLYPGSFIPVSRREKGEKYYWILEITGEEAIDLQKRPVRFESSWYFREETLFLVPGHESAPQEELRQLLESIEPDDRCRLNVVVDGFLPEEKELGFRNKLLEVTGGFEDQFGKIQLDWNVIGTDKIDTPLVNKFIRKVEALDNSEVEPKDFLENDESQLADYFRETIEEEFGRVKREILKRSLQIFSERLD